MAEQADGELRGASRSLPEPTGTQLGIHKEWQVQQPPWLNLEHTGEKTEHGVTLQVHSLSINPGELTPESGLSQAEIALLSRYRTEIRVWSEAPIDIWYKAVANPQTSFTLLAEGLASNHTQWTRTGNSFVHRWHTYINNRIKPNLPPAQQNLSPITLAVSCPGFGGSALRDESHITTNDVSDHTYARYLDTLVNLLRIPDDRSIAAGHSAGGEALLSWAMGSEFSTSTPIVALHPAVGSSFQAQFSLLDKAQAIAAKVTGKLRGIKLTATEALIRTVLDFPLTGPLTLQQEHQIRSHMHEIKIHRDAFRAKLRELAQPRPPDPTRLVQMVALPLILTGSKDRLTPRDVQKKWLDAAFLIGNLAKFGLVFPELGQVQAKKAEQLKPLIETKGAWGHAAVFTQESAQRQALELLDTQLELQLAAEWPVYREVHEIISYLHTQRLPVHLAYDPLSQGLFEANAAYLKARQKGSEELLTLLRTDTTSFRFRLEQAETLCQWAEAQNILDRWKREYMDQEGMVTIPTAEVEKFIQKIFGLHGTRPFYEAKGYKAGYPSFTTVAQPERVSIEALYLFNAKRGEVYRIESAHLNDWLKEPKMLGNFKMGVQGVLNQLQAAHLSGQGKVDAKELRSEIDRALAKRLRCAIKEIITGDLLSEAGLASRWDRTITPPTIPVYQISAYSAS